MRLVDYMTEGGIAVLTLNDLPENAYTHEMMRDLDSAILEARFDNDVHVIVLTGHGDKHFCSGANINMLREADATFAYYFALHTAETLRRLEQTPKLCIAAINGSCLAGGAEIALSCDIRIARKGSGKLGFPEVSWGLLPSSGGPHRLCKAIGQARAFELLAEGQLIDFEAAASMGLVHRVIEASSREQFLTDVKNYARRFMPPHRPSRAVGLIKRAVQAGGEMSIDDALSLERELYSQLFGSEDAEEGLRASSERRSASFRTR